MNVIFPWGRTERSDADFQIWCDCGCSMIDVSLIKECQQDYGSPVVWMSLYVLSNMVSLFPKHYSADVYVSVNDLSGIINILMNGGNALIVDGGSAPYHGKYGGLVVDNTNGEEFLFSFVEAKEKKNNRWKICKVVQSVIVDKRHYLDLLHLFQVIYEEARKVVDKYKVSSKMVQS